MLDPSSLNTKVFSTFNKEQLRTFLKNPLSNYVNLRNLSRYLYYRSQVYRRIIHYNANMIDLNLRTIIPINTNYKKEAKTDDLLNSFYETSLLINKMNLPLELLKAYIVCWREDVFYGCVYSDDTGFFVLPLDPDYCKVTAIYPTGDLAFDMDMTYFTRRKEQLEMWGEPFTSMYKEYQKNTVKGRWQPMPDKNCLCLKVNIDDWETPLPPYIALFNSLINLEDLNEITAIADEMQIYKLLVFRMPLISGSKEVNDFAVDPTTTVEYANRFEAPDYTEKIVSPVEIETIEFNHDQAQDVSKIENATKAVLTTSGGVQTLCPPQGTTAYSAAIKSDEDYAISSLLPQTEAWLNRWLSYQLKNPAKVKFLEVTKYTKKEYKDSLIKDMNFGAPVAMLLNTLNGFSELETISMAKFNQALNLQSLFVPLATSSTSNGNELVGGRPTSEESGNDMSDSGEASRDKREANE